MKNESVEEFSKRAQSLLRIAIQVCGGPEDLTLLNRYMQQAKARRMTWVEGLEYSIHANKVSGQADEVVN